MPPAITAAKTITSLILTNGISSNISIGPTNATQVSVLPSSSASASMKVVGTTQSLQPNVWTSPVVTNNDLIDRIQCNDHWRYGSDLFKTIYCRVYPFYHCYGYKCCPKKLWRL